MKEELISKSDYERRKENDVLRRRKMADFWLTMSHTLLGSYVIGFMLMLYGMNEDIIDDTVTIVVFIVGIILVIVSAVVGYRLLR